MRATESTIWQVPAYLPYLQPSLTDDIVVAAEKKIGYKLPREYLNILRKQNGGYIRFSLPSMGEHTQIAGIGPNFPSLTEFDWDEPQEYVSYPLRGLVPFDGDGHWYMCLDYRKNSQVPAVTYADLECDRETQIAESFAEYLSMLRLPLDNEFVVEAVSNIEELKVKLSRQLGTPFDPTDGWAHGYPVERVRLGKEGNPQWLWLSPNTVMRGFVRTDDARHSVLKDLMPGLADRYPGLPADSYILQATDGVRAQVLEALSRSNLIVRALLEYVEGGA